MSRTLDAILDDRGAKPEPAPVSDYVHRGQQGDKEHFTPETWFDRQTVPSNKYEGAAMMAVPGYGLASIGAVEYGSISPAASSVTAGAIMGAALTAYLCKGGQELYEASKKTPPIDDLPENTSFSEDEPVGDAIQASYTVLD